MARIIQLPSGKPFAEVLHRQAPLPVQAEADSPITPDLLVGLAKVAIGAGTSIAGAIKQGQALDVQKEQAKLAREKFAVEKPLKAAKELRDIEKANLDAQKTRFDMAVKELDIPAKQVEAAIANEIIRLTNEGMTRKEAANKALSDLEAAAETAKTARESKIGVATEEAKVASEGSLITPSPREEAVDRQGQPLPVEKIRAQEAADTRRLAKVRRELGLPAPKPATVIERVEGPGLEAQRLKVVQEAEARAKALTARTPEEEAAATARETLSTPTPIQQMAQDQIAKGAQVRFEADVLTAMRNTPGFDLNEFSAAKQAELLAKGTAALKAAEDLKLATIKAEQAEEEGGTKIRVTAPDGQVVLVTPATAEAMAKAVKLRAEMDWIRANGGKPLSLALAQAAAGRAVRAEGTKTAKEAAQELVDNTKAAWDAARTDRNKLPTQIKDAKTVVRKATEALAEAKTAKKAARGRALLVASGRLDAAATALELAQEELTALEGSAETLDTVVEAAKAAWDVAVAAQQQLLRAQAPTTAPTPGPTPAPAPTPAPGGGGMGGVMKKAFGGQ